MKKIAFINPPGPRYLFRGTVCTYLSKARYVWKPKDFILLSSRVPEDWKVTFLDASINRVSHENALNWLGEQGADAIVIALSSVAWETDKKFLKAVRKKYPNSRLMCFSDALLEEALRKQVEGGVDNLIFDPLRFDIEAAVLGKPVESKMGVRGEKKETKDLMTHIPRHSLFDNLKYRWPFIKKRRYAAVFTQYGCPYTCSYCTESLTKVTYRPAESILKEMRFLKDQGYQELHIGDSSFGYPRSNAIKLLQGMVKEKFDFGWSSYIHPAQGDRDVLTLMANSGCHTVVTGIDSADMELLRNYGRNITRSKIQTFVETCHELGMEVCGDIMLGFKEDTKESCLRTSQFAIDLDLDYVSINIVTPLLGSSVRDAYKKEAFFREERTGFDTAGIKDVIGTENLSREELLTLRSNAVRRFYLRPKYLARRLIRNSTSYESFMIQANEGMGIMLNMSKQLFLGMRAS